MTDKVDPAALAERLDVWERSFRGDGWWPLADCLKEAAAALRQRPQEERPAGLSLSLQNDPLAVTELLADGQRERERLHALLLEIMRAIPEGHAIPQDQWPDEIRKLASRPQAPEERPDLIADVERLQRRLPPGLNGFSETLDRVLSALRAQSARKVKEGEPGPFNDAEWDDSYFPIQKPTPAERTWQPIETAPKDGTWIEIRWHGSQLPPVAARWVEAGDHWSSWRTKDEKWFTSADQWRPVLAGPQARQEQEFPTEHPTGGNR